MNASVKSLYLRLFVSETWVKQHPLFLPPSPPNPYSTIDSMER